MGIETMILVGVGLGAMQAASALSQSKKEAKAAVREGSIAAENKSRSVRAMAASQAASFMGSGLALEGTPMSVIGSTFSTGREDINQIIQNTNTKSKNIMSAGRTQAISSLVSGTMSGISAGGGLSALKDMFGTTAAGFGATASSNTANFLSAGTVEGAGSDFFFGASRI